MELINTYLSGIIMPFLLMGAGIYFGFSLRFVYILHPRRVISELKCKAAGSGVTPARALTEALAGTLGVGNMTGVAAAICHGGAGAVFWMWVSATLAMSVKYFEVALAVKCRRGTKDGYFGGAMYYIKDIFAKKRPRLSGALGGAFAVLCIINSLLTGNIVQMNSAAAAAPSIPPLLLGLFIAVLSLAVCVGNTKKVSHLTSYLIPALCALYVLISFIIIIPQAHRLPEVFSEIIKSAFSLRAAGGGVGGFLFLRALRFGTTRGIFSNEAGSGTSPTAHASACAKSPHSQGCFGIFEVFADTILLCTLTALVILLSDGCQKGFSGMSLTLYAFSSQAGGAAGLCIGIAAVLFAYATVICQTRYGIVALKSITKSPLARAVYLILSFGCTVFGTTIGEGLMWQAADLIISLMTALNVTCLLAAAKGGMLSSLYPDPSFHGNGEEIRRRKKDRILWDKGQGRRQKGLKERRFRNESVVAASCGVAKKKP